MDAQKKVAEWNGHECAYFDIGSGEPVLLLHGFASNAATNWIHTGWVKVLNEAGYRCIAVDQRGHGDSKKYYTAEDYGPDIFAADAIGLLDHLGIEKCRVLGFSMGARVTAWIAAHYPERMSQAVFGGMGTRLTASGKNYEEIAKALEVDDPSTITDSAGASFRRFADRTNSDRLALAACIRPSREKITDDMVRTIVVPVLVAVGDEDEIAGLPGPLADMMPNAEAHLMPGLDHMRSTGAAPFKEKVVSFFAEGSGAHG